MTIQLLCMCYAALYALPLAYPMCYATLIVTTVSGRLLFEAPLLYPNMPVLLNDTSPTLLLSAAGVAPDLLWVCEGRGFFGCPLLLLADGPCGGRPAIPLHYTTGNGARSQPSPHLLSRHTVYGVAKQRWLSPTQGRTDSFLGITFYVTYSLVTIQFALHWFADTSGLPRYSRSVGVANEKLVNSEGKESDAENRPLLFSNEEIAELAAPVEENKEHEASMT